MILDRGFRDVIKELREKYNLVPYMPSLIKNDEKQLSTIEANTSRFVTKIRYVIEVVNAKLKCSFKALKEVPNKSLPHSKVDYEIAAALINKYFSRMISDKIDGEQIVSIMKSRKNRVNTLMKVVEDHDLFKNSQFKKLDAVDINDFPQLDQETIKTQITLGNYQLKQAIGYITEHFDKNGKYSIMLNENQAFQSDTKLLRAEIRSRHSNATKYKTYVQYIPNVNDASSILEWYCTCKVGARTVGCCSHISSVIYYFAIGKSNENLKRTLNLQSIFPFGMKAVKKIIHK